MWSAGGRCRGGDGGSGRPNGFRTEPRRGGDMWRIGGGDRGRIPLKYSGGGRSSPPTPTIAASCSNDDSIDGSAANSSSSMAALLLSVGRSGTDCRGASGASDDTADIMPPEGASSICKARSERDHSGHRLGGSRTSRSLVNTLTTSAPVLTPSGKEGLGGIWSRLK